MFKEMLLMLHPTFGMFGTLAALWVFVEVLNISKVNQIRVQIAALVQLICMWASYFLGGYWYVLYYPADKALIKAGPWSWAHSFVMESKEHLFLLLLLLSIYLVIAVFTNDLLVNKHARRLLLWVSALIVLFGLGMEGAGAIIAMGVKVALMAQ